MARTKAWPANNRVVTETDYTAPHPQSLAIVNAFAQRHALYNAGEQDRIAFGEYAERGPGAFSGDLGPHQQFRGAAGMVGYTAEPPGLQTGLPDTAPPSDRVPTIYDLMRDMDNQTDAGLTMTGGAL